MKQKQSDASQKFDIAVGFLFEFYRSLMACFLIAFVPQQCGDDVCGVFENMYNGKGGLYDAATSINIITFLLFMTLYKIEIEREHRMIDYLEINRELPKDNESVGEALLKLSDDKEHELHILDHRYKLAGYSSFVFFLINIGVSMGPIVEHRINSKTFTVLLTNLLFVASKIYEIYTIVNTKENIFLSAYLTERQQFNDVDPDYLLVTSDKVDEEIPLNSLSVKITTNEGEEVDDDSSMVLQKDSEDEAENNSHISSVNLELIHPDELTHASSETDI
tara:strand:+ start:1935 stop:2765 length:831 start_codon:yes stop_codon:yes gene_type:complete